MQASLRTGSARPRYSSRSRPGGARALVRPGQDVRAFRAAVLEGPVAAPVSLAIRAALAEAKVVADPAANERLAKAGEGQHRRRRREGKMSCESSNEWLCC